MGLKSGSRDAGLDDSEKNSEQSVSQDPEIPHTTTEATSEVSPDPPVDADSESMNDPKLDAQRPTIESLPYKLRREKVNEGREQVPYFLREEVIEAEDDLQDTLEELLEEDVYKSDYREAAMVAAQRHPELIAEILREWGYDLDAM